MPQKRRLDLPRLNAKTAHLNLLVRAPHKLQCSIPAPARQVPAAVHPTPRSTKPIRNKAPPSETHATQITTRHTRSRNVKLPNNPNRNRLQTTIQNVYTRVPYRPPSRWHPAPRHCPFHERPNCRPRRPVGFVHPRAL